MDSDRHAVPELTPLYTHPETGITWRRTGECNRCGECCFGDPFNGTRGENVLAGRVACPLLRSQADGTFACGDRQDAYYLNGCVVFPQFPDQVASYPSCSYRFEQVETEP